MHLNNVEEELLRLANRGCDSELSQSDTARLETLLHDNPAAQRVWLQLVEQDMLLSWLVECGPLADADKFDEKRLQSVADNRHSPVFYFLPRTIHALRQPLLWSILGVGVVFAVYIVTISWNMLSRDLAAERVAHPSRASASRNPGEAASSAHVAVIEDAIDAKWATPTEPRRNAAMPQYTGKVTPGQSLRVDSGIIVLTLAQGTRLTVQGPAEWTIDEKNAATLTAGRAFVHVPAAAVGFVLNTPSARIVDLGTEFGVSVTGRHRTEVHMVSGAADVLPRSGSATSAERLVAGQAVCLESPSSAEPIAVRRVAFDPHWTAPGRMATSPNVSRVGKLVLVSGGKPVTSASTFQGGNLIFTPSAVTDGRLNDGGGPDDFTFWVAKDGITAAELLVDLQQTYEITEIRLRNTHNGKWQNRGTRDFRVFVSENGQDYQLVADGTLPCAFGLDAVPTERFPLKIPVQGRYVRFQALSCYGLAPGLNEIEVYSQPGKGRSLRSQQNGL